MNAIQLKAAFVLRGGTVNMLSEDLIENGFLAVKEERIAAITERATISGRV
jgi:hypothetical protein